MSHSGGETPEMVIKVENIRENIMEKRMYRPMQLFLFT